MIEPLSQEVIGHKLKLLNDNATEPWGLVDGKLYREFKFPSFVAAFGFMTQVAILAERADHHPEWSNIYRKVKIYLITYEARGISQRDFDLAHEISQIL
ncbi:4a-hydroxytetrahydrobiopterin dehydratase [Desulfopila sp. IMCC35006]|uniref:4a-hydroxytetrahydrobiopterin dehydratase n=1 Tax=Desulfopila sp. IMCC35006 TaxID=2569542 RepID=UPI0010AB7F5F|nr:4a-hydroxytetrahydrobiopterin dehydratase [Desulfopila sp. IMCC35006]TKB23267.1 4a-hydroxytetrahydrobiopterin dehydratase [Desulfopila sp. IMCC35006]